MNTLTAQETASLLHISLGTLRVYCAQGKLSPIRVNRRKFLYRAEDVQNLLSVKS